MRHFFRRHYASLIALSCLMPGAHALASEKAASLGSAAAAFSRDADWTLPATGETKYTKSIWTRADEGAGVETFARAIAKSKNAADPTEEKRVVLRESGALNSASRYALFPATSAKGAPRETSASLQSDGASWSAFTRCEDKGAGQGRICLTVTPVICEKSKAARLELSSGEMEALEKAEVRSIALILTLRGSEHQLDNVVRFGNRMGVKEPAQTTKGRLLRATQFPEFPKELRAACADLGAQS